ncbi:Endonuclease/exonuclease/phosphatase-like protein [Diaporthe sp. PMI_573]|nr:Endonuclease/exonuclease/phosphatase-like protein [Diaporthaceae sp. PMI_573]
MKGLLCGVASALLTRSAAAVSISEINGNKFLSPYNGQSLTNISGLVTAKSSTGIFVRSTVPDNDTSTSDSAFIYSSSVGSSVSVGDIITFGARVTEYRSSGSTYLYLTELTSPTNVVVVSSNNTVTPLVIGEDTLNPPTEQFSSLDGGDVYAIPNAVANISSVNPVLDPASYGLDFWESLSAELVTIKNVTVISRPNSYGETWVTGGWPATGRSARGSLTMTALDSNPEVIKIDDPLDGTKNPTAPKIGDKAADITGVVYQQFGFYYILPLTAFELTTLAAGTAPATTLESSRSCEAITVGDYNVENLAPTTANLEGRADHIVNALGAPDLMFVQEIQDSSGATNDGVVDANATLTALVDAIAAVGNVTYSFVEIAPEDGQDGGQPGGNIRVAYLYRPEVVSLYKPSPGDSTTATEVVSGDAGPELTLNPGRIDPANPCWDASRKPLVAAWLAEGATKPFFTVNVHWSSKGGSSSLQGDLRPPVNGVVSNRLVQANVTGQFIDEILAIDPSAAVIAAGDFNEFAFVEPLTTFAEISGLTELDEVVGIPPEERYTYTFDMNTQALDHMYVSPVLEEGAGYEHIHVNTWAAENDVVSDHDPSVARFGVCGA